MLDLPLPQMPVHFVRFYSLYYPISFSTRLPLPKVKAEDSVSALSDMICAKIYSLINK